MPEGLLSPHLVNGLEPGTIVRLAAPEGDFVLPDPPPRRMLFLVGGSGITPVMAMLRTLDRRRTMPDVVLHYSSPTPERMIFRDELADLEQRHDGLTIHRLHTDTDGMLDLADLDEICPDWRERETWALRPRPDARRDHRALRGGAASRTSCTSSGSRSSSAATAARAAPSPSATPAGPIEVDGATTVLEAGEQAGIGMPYGCRMGICHTCTLTLVSGRVRDLRNGDEYDQPNEQVQTCITAAVGDCTLDI